MELLTPTRQHFLLTENTPGAEGFSSPTCRDLEKNYGKILSGNLSEPERALLMVDAGLGHPASRFYQGRVVGLEEWTGEAAPETIVALVKNPDNTLLCVPIVGMQNALFEAQGTLFAAIVTSHGFLVKRQVRSRFQEVLLAPFRDLARKVEQPLPNVNTLTPMLKTSTT